MKTRKYSHEKIKSFFPNKNFKNNFSKPVFKNDFLSISFCFFQSFPQKGKFQQFLNSLIHKISPICPY